MSRRDHESRLARVETVLGVGVGPLTRAEQIELLQLEDEHAHYLPGDPDEIPAELLDDALAYLTASVGSIGRLAHLRHRALPASEQHEIHAIEIAVAAMSLEELDAWMLEMTAAAQGEDHADHG